MPRLLVIGGASLLGQYVLSEAHRRGLEPWVTVRRNGLKGETVLPADLRDPDSLNQAFEASRPDLVVLCAALTGVDYCEEHPQEADLVNAQGPRAVARLCQAHGASLVHVSTDYVFDGAAGPYDEAAEPRPLGVYGESKRAGEVGVLEGFPDAAVVRACALFGWNHAREKANSVTWILNRVHQGETVPLFTDQRVSPSYAADAAAAILDIGAMGGKGVFHVAPPDCVTRWELGQLVCQVFDLPSEGLQTSTLAEANLPAERPPHSCLTSTRLAGILNTPVRPLEAALQHMREAE